MSSQFYSVIPESDLLRKWNIYFLSLPKEIWKTGQWQYERVVVFPLLSTFAFQIKWRLGGKSSECLLVFHKAVLNMLH